jgi:flagellar protein FlaG
MTSAPSVSRVDSPQAPPPSGKDVAPSGESLPLAPPTPPAADVAQAVERLNEIMSTKQRSLRFQIDESSGRTVITVINKSTLEIVRQIPSEELLAVAQQLEDFGTLIDTLI